MNDHVRRAGNNFLVCFLIIVATTFIPGPLGSVLLVASMVPLFRGMYLLGVQNER